MLSLLGGSLPSQAHHRHQYYFHWAGFPGQINVYNCNADATRLQTAVNNWNASGGFGTVFVYGGTNCSASTGIIAYIGSGFCQNCGQFNPFDAGPVTQRTQEALRDSTQLGREWYQGIQGQFKITRAFLYVGQGAPVGVYGHELGHAIGLNEHYVDVTVVNCVTYSVPTIMDCEDGHTGPQAHDASDGPGRYDAAPAWGDLDLARHGDLDNDQVGRSQR